MPKHYKSSPSFWIQELSSYERGMRTECCVRTVLERLGYTILGTNVRTPYAQVDLIFEDQGTLVLAEVKYRHSWDDYEFGLSLGQYLRLEHALEHLSSQYSHPNVRFDVICCNEQRIVHHHRNISMELSCDHTWNKCC